MDVFTEYSVNVYGGKVEVESRLHPDMDHVYLSLTFGGFEQRVSLGFADPEHLRAIAKAALEAAVALEDRLASRVEVPA